MSRDQESVIDIVNPTKRILRYTAVVSREELSDNDEKLSAILYQITIIGEAPKRLSDSFRQRHVDIPWREMAGMRDIIVHDYDQLDFEVVWDVVANKLPALAKQLETLLR